MVLRGRGIPLIACVAIAALLFERLTWSGTRLTAALTVAFAAAVLGSVALLATPLTRKHIRGAGSSEARLLPV